MSPSSAGLSTLPDDVLLPLVCIAVTPPQEGHAAEPSDLRTLAALAGSCRRLRDAVRDAHVPLVFCVGPSRSCGNKDTENAANALERYTTAHCRGFTRARLAPDFQIFIKHPRGQPPVCACSTASLLDCVGRLAPTLTVLDLDGLAPCINAMSDLAEDVLPRCHSLSSIRLARWRLAREPRARLAARAVWGLQRVLAALPASVKLLEVVRMFTGSSAERGALRAAGVAPLGEHGLQAAAGAAPRVQHLALRDHSLAPPQDAWSGLVCFRGLTGLFLADVRFHSIAALGHVLCRASPTIEKLLLVTDPRSHTASDVHEFLSALEGLTKMHSLQLAGLSDDPRASSPLVRCVQPALSLLHVEGMALSQETCTALRAQRDKLSPPPAMWLFGYDNISVCAV